MTFAEYAIQPFTPNIDPEYKEIAIKLASISALCKYIFYLKLTVPRFFLTFLFLSIRKTNRLASDSAPHYGSFLRH